MMLRKVLEPKIAIDFSDANGYVQAHYYCLPICHCGCALKIIKSGNAKKYRAWHSLAYLCPENYQIIRRENAY